MKLSPLDIRKQNFDSALRGYSKEDVEAFLQMLSEQWEELQEEKRRLEEQVRSLQDKMDHYEQVEEALQEALQTARENSEQKLENAEKKARLMVQEAEARADEIKREAREDRELLRRQVDQLQERRDKGVAGLRAFLMSEMELLLRFDGEDPEALRQSLPDQLAQHIGGAEKQSGTEERGAARNRQEAGEGPRTESEPSPGTETAPAAGRAADEVFSAVEGSKDEARQKPPESASGGEEAASQPSGRPNMPVSDDFSDDPTSPATDRESPPPPADPAPGEPTADSETTPEKKTGGEAGDPDELTDFLKQFEEGQAGSEGADTSAGASQDEASQGAGAPPAQSEDPGEEEPAPGKPSTEPDAPEPLDAPVKETLAAQKQAREAAPGDGAPSEGASGEGDMTATADEIDKIRRILNDMD